MRNAMVIQAEMRAVAKKARQAANDPSLSTQQIKSFVDSAEAEIDRLEKELETANTGGLGYKALGFDPSELGNAPAGGGIGARDLKSFGVSGAVGRGAPPLLFDETDLKALFDAASTGAHYAITTKAATDSTSVAPAVMPDYRLPPLPFRREPSRVLALLRTTATDRTEVDYFKVTTAASAAAAVAEGGAKPQSNPVYSKSTAPVRKLAHYVELTDETLTDYPMFLSVIQEELLAGLILAENDELLNGSGTAPHLTGILNASGILTRARSTDTQLDALFKAVTDLRAGSSYVQADGIVLHPTDAQTIFTSKDSQGRYLAGDPLDGTSRTLWGIPVTVTTQIAAGTSLVASFAELGMAFIRLAPRIDVANQGTTQFVNNTTLVRCEERLALAIERPTAAVKVTGM